VRAVLPALLLIACASAANATTCSARVSVGTIDYDATDPAGGSFSGVIEVICSRAAAPLMARVSVDGGRSGDPARRALADGRGHTLAYALLLADGRPWGDGSRGTAAALQTIVANRTLIPFNAQIAPFQTMPPGVYSDRLTATVDL
jgi:spore coat protein U-like protein